VATTKAIKIQELNSIVSCHLVLSAKVRISERKAKEKAIFLLLFRAKVPSATVKGTNKRAKSKRKTRFSFVLPSNELGNT
jgi:hypothetical protein